MANQKIEVTKYVATQFGLPTDDKSLRKLIAQWWAYPRHKDRGGLKLTDEGFARLTAHITSYPVLFVEPMEYTNQLVLYLDNFINCPWYISKKHLYVFDDKMAVQLVLFEGNIARFSRAKAESVKNSLTKS